MEKLEITAVSFGIAQAAVEAKWSYAQQRVQQRRPCSVETSVAKLFVADTGVQIAVACQRVVCAYGLSEGHDMERNVQDLLGMPIVGGSSAMQKNDLARRWSLLDRSNSALCRG